ncbi:integral membrane protein possibly involved in chromosome condensation, CrcB-like protein [unidentified eubacterium SCB49]|nr:integral membrane protein possibly involved in chromosome condensation, CrcB-like protein [unidentified eubacterium SCB49]
MKAVLLVFLGGGLGSALRYVISRALNSTPPGFPYGTFAVNVIGSLIIGIILGFALKHHSPSSNTALFIATGLCGGFTTFSAFAYENVMFLKAGDYQTFIIYTLGSIVLGLAAVFAGIYLSRLF